MKTLTKKDIAKRTAQIIDDRVYHVEKTINATFDSLREVMMEADPDVRIEIRDFGVFEVKKTKAKPKARNPKTGEIIYVKPRRKTHFKPGKILKEVLRNPIES